MKLEEIVTALRCCASIDGSGCGICPSEELDGKEICCGDALKLSAADALEKLLDRCARYAEEIAVLQERQRWIPVTERLPSKDGPYIVHCDDTYAPSDERIWGGSVVLEADWCFGAWGWNENGNEYDLDGIVTHWKPLPEAPEVE